jgi:O-methyltransferase domain/Dimerisation domain
MASNPITTESAAANAPSAAAVQSAAAGVPPHVELIQMVMAIWTARAIHAAAELGLADLLADQPRTADDLARTTGMHAGSLYRLLRALASRGVLTESEPGRFALTKLGAALESDAPGAARATVLTFAGHWQSKAWDNFQYSLQTGQPALGKVYGMGLFEYLAAHPEDSARFDEAMVGMYRAVGPAVVAAYDFSPFRTVIDLGGGTGMLLTAILRANPRTHGTLFELPHTVPKARCTVETSGLSARCEVIEGDFFRSVPAGHDAYILSHVLHDWNSKRCRFCAIAAQQLAKTGGC